MILPPPSKVREMTSTPSAETVTRVYVGRIIISILSLPGPAYSINVCRGIPAIGDAAVVCSMTTSLLAGLSGTHFDKSRNGVYELGEDKVVP